MCSKEVKVSRNILIICESLILSILFIKLKKQKQQKNTSHNFMTNESQLKIKKAMVERIEQGLWTCMELNSYPWGKLMWF